MSALRERHTFFVTCAPGLEPVLFEEAKALALPKLERQIGGVRFEGTLIDAWRANLWLRTAVRVLLRIQRFEARHADALLENAMAVEWERWLAPEGFLWIDAQSRDSALDHTRFIEQCVKDAICDRFRASTGVRPSVRKEAPDLRVHVHVSRDRVTLSLDTSDDSLHKRGWRAAQGRAPVSETLAAAMVMFSGWNQRAPLVDPFCGSGTILVEAALLAANAAPGLYRPRFGFESWLVHDAAAFAKLKDEAAALRRELPRKLRLVGLDVDPARIDDARANLAATGFDDRVELEVSNATEFAPLPGWNAWIVTNPPYGERIGEAAETEELYRAFGGQLREHCAGYRLALLAGSPEHAKALGMGGLKRHTVVHGGAERVLATGEIR
ncbi:MAG: RNA methyltransferase [bacterium]|nr:RNA methyltransferase [bacterium]